MAVSNSLPRRIRGRLLRLVPRAVKDRIKNGIRRVEIAYARRQRLGRDDFSRFLRGLGLGKGDVVCVHSSLDGFRGFEGLSPLTIIEVLKETVGNEGTLLLPTLPFLGSALDYVADGPVFDVRRTPSMMGLISELFRRSSDVERSVHPTHSAAAWGRRAEALLADHHLARTPAGRQSPYGRLLDHDGRILMLGVDILSMTFYHVVDELLEDRLPFQAFTKEVYRLESKDSSGRVLETRTRLYEDSTGNQRDVFERRLESLLKRSRRFRQGRVGTLRGILLEADEVLDAAVTLVEAPP